VYWVLGACGVAGLFGLGFGAGKAISEKVWRSKEIAVPPAPTVAQEKFPKAFLTWNEDFGAWSFYYVVEDKPAERNVPVSLADGTVIGVAESAARVKYFDSNGRKREVLVAQRVKLPDGSYLPGVEELQKPRGNLVVGTSIVEDFDRDFGEKKRQNPNAQRNYALEKFVKEYYGSHRSKLDKFLTGGDPEIGLIIPVGYLGTGRTLSGWE